MRDGQGRVYGRRREVVANATWAGRARAAAIIGSIGLLLGGTGCSWLMERTDRQVAALIEARQREALDYEEPINVQAPEHLPQPGKAAYRYVPSPTNLEVPPGFAPSSQPATQPMPESAETPEMTPEGRLEPPRPAPTPEEPPATRPATTTPDEETATEGTPAATAPETSPTTRPATMPAPELVEKQPYGAFQNMKLTRPRRLLTLVDALAYAQEHRREYMTAKEDLYLSALALTLERHLWTPIFSSNLRTVYGNFGEIRDFDQAMRFVADLGVSQRLPYGGVFTAQAIATLVRDVKQTITAEEGGAVQLGVDIPLLRGAGHVARETLIQLERELTYSVRTFERFRRRQLVLVAQSYFDLLRVKQRVIDSEGSVERARLDYDRAQAVQEASTSENAATAPLDTMRAEQRLLSSQNQLADARESFRARADQFKLTIGMPVEEPLVPDDLASIETIEQRIAEGVYPALRNPPAVDNEEYAIDVALRKRLDLLTTEDRIEDARRGVANSENALLPDFNFAGSVTFESDPEHYNVADIRLDRATWRAELLLELPLERTAERNELRRALIDVRQAQRIEIDLAERIRAEVRDALYQLRLESTVLQIQRRNLYVAQRRAEYASIQYEEGKITNRDKIEAETELLDALNALNAAKTARWATLLDFRYATETLRIGEDGRQTPDPDLDLAPDAPAPPDEP